MNSEYFKQPQTTAIRAENGTGHPKQVTEFDGTLSKSQDSLKSSLDSSTRHCPTFLRCHAIAFYIVVAFVWAVLSLPIILYFAPISSLQVSEEITTRVK